MIVYISIGNSDDKLSQAEWANFVREVEEEIDSRTVGVHGRWFSSPRSPFQNACWCIELDHVKAAWIRRELARLARVYRQDSIAWAEAPATEFISPEAGDDGR